MTIQSSPRPHRSNRLPLLCALLLPLACLFLAVGCESDNSLATTHPGDAALRDPMGYKVNDWPTVSGNGPFAGLSVFTYFYAKYATVIDEKLRAGVFANSARIFAAPRESRRV